MFIYWLWRPAMGSISCCSGIKFSTAEREVMCSANLQGDQFVDSQKSRVQAAKLSIWAVATRKDFYLLMLINAFSGCESFKYG